MSNQTPKSLLWYISTIWHCL